MLNRVTMVMNSDFYHDTQGGVENYVKDLTLALEEKGVRVTRVGASFTARGERPEEILVSRNRGSNYLFLLMLARTVIRLRGQRGLIVHVQRPDHLVPFLLSRRKGTALVTTIHGPQRKAVLENNGRIIGGIYSALEVIGLRTADAVVFTDARTLDWYLDVLPWLKGKATMIPPGVPAAFLRRIPRGEATAKLGLAGSERILSFVGRLEHEKNVDLIIRAFSKVSPKHGDLRLAIAGDGSLRKELETLAKDLGIQEKVTFLGQLDRERVRYLLLSSDAMVLVSKWEGSPLVLREALAAGTPVICADVGDACQLVEDESCGYVVRNLTEQSLAEAMEREYSRGGARVPESYGAEFCWDRIADKYIAIYEASAGTHSA